MFICNHCPFVIHVIDEIVSISENYKDDISFVAISSNDVIKLGDFYFYDSAMSLKQRVKNEFKVNEVKINKLSKTKFRVYLGPYDNLNSLKNAFNKISILNFENIEIIKI